MEKRDRKAKVEVPMMVDDARFAPQGRGSATEVVRIEEDFFLDGPVSRRVAVLDFDPKTGALRRLLQLGDWRKLKTGVYNKNLWAWKGDPAWV